MLFSSGTSQRYSPLSMLEEVPLGLFSCMLWSSPQLWYRVKESGEPVRGALVVGWNQFPERLVSQQNGLVVTQSSGPGLEELESPRLSRDMILLLAMSCLSCTITTSRVCTHHQRYMTLGFVLPSSL